MRLALTMTAFLIFGCATHAAPVISPDEAEDMRAQALLERADRIHGQSDFILDDEDTYVDATTGTNPREENCAKTPVHLKRSDGTTVVKRIDICE